MTEQRTAVEAVNTLGAQWSPDVDAYAAGQISAAQVRCVLCGHAPCDCPPFGSDAYFAMLDRVHGRAR
jgi:predicted dienelactone hydrolase